MNSGFSSEMIFLFLLALILFGPKKLPEIGRQIGRIMNEFRRASNEFRAQIESEINSVQSDVKPQILPPIQAPLGALASRIFNPPSNPASDHPSEPASSENKPDAEAGTALSAVEEANPAMEPVAASSASAPKVAPDA
ncbi:MAG: twin-arginine translocase TatA/TatE family subunit [Terriglobales bacterium]|jgi:sec-independent protein translocase protein TatB